MFDRAQMAGELDRLAKRGVYVGTSSWKYPGWCGQVYDESRYAYRGRFAEKRFNERCLEEYAETFPTVCVDAAYYQFPSVTYLGKMAAQVPDGFKLTFKVTDTITIKHFTKLPRFGDLAGKDNPCFLDHEKFIRLFLGPMESIRDKVGMLIFEFSRFYPRDFERGRDFVEALDRFLGELPPDWQYGVEIRNKGFLQPDYFSMLARHKVAHVFNAWTQMPAISEQMALDGAFTTDFFGARFLLKTGRKYEEAVKLFQPYETVAEVREGARDAGAGLIDRVASASVESSRPASSRPSFVYVNNRLEGNAPTTIQEMLVRRR